MRGERRRRALLLAIAALLLLSVGPVFGHHFADGVEGALRGRDHLGALCLVALHHLLAPVNLLFHALVAAGLAYAALDRLRAHARVRRTLAPLEAARPAPGDPFHAAAVAAGLDPARLRVVPGLPVPAFTVGWLRPRVYAAASLPALLSPGQLRALLAHEGEHLRRLDPLRLSLLRFLALALFWLPALARLAADVADEAELRADDAAARGGALELASALLLLAGWRAHPLPGGAPGIAAGSRGLLERRVRRLAGEEPPPASHLTRRSLAGAMAMLALVWLSGAMMAHPLPEAQGGDAHCHHPGGSPLEHLFCLTAAAREEGHRACPHRTNAS